MTRQVPFETRQLSSAGMYSFSITDEPKDVLSLAYQRSSLAQHLHHVDNLKDAGPEFTDAPGGHAHHTLIVSEPRTGGGLWDVVKNVGRAALPSVANFVCSAGKHLASTYGPQPQQGSGMEMDATGSGIHHHKKPRMFNFQ